MTAERDFMSHLLVCGVCANGPHFCEEGLRLGNLFEDENRHLDSIAGMCWEPPLEIDYPSEEVMERGAREWADRVDFRQGKL